MKAIAEATRPWIELISQLRKEHAQLAGVLREIGPIKPRRIRYTGSLVEGKQLHMPCGVTTPLQPP